MRWTSGKHGGKNKCLCEYLQLTHKTYLCVLQQFLENECPKISCCPCQENSLRSPGVRHLERTPECSETDVQPTMENLFQRGAAHKLFYNTLSNCWGYVTSNDMVEWLWTANWKEWGKMYLEPALRIRASINWWQWGKPWSISIKMAGSMPRFIWIWTWTRLLTSVQ